MKRSILASILGITLSGAFVASSYGQGYGQGVVMFDNYSNIAHDEQVTWWDGTVVTDTSVVIGLWAGPNGASSSALTLIATTHILPQFGGAGGGWYEGGSVTIPSTLFTGTQTVEFQVRGYYLGMLYGTSALWTETSQSQGGSIVGFSLPANEMLNGPLPLVFLGIPEPSTIALAGLGAGILCLLRHRKQPFANGR